MKLLIILSIDEHKQDVRKLLKNEGVPVYSETDIYGFNTEEHKPDMSNWFAHDHVERFSKLFFSIQTEGAVKRVLEAVRKYNSNEKHDKSSPLHAYQLNIEASA